MLLVEDDSWQELLPLIEAIRIKGRRGNRTVRVVHLPEPLICVGCGTDGAVFIHRDYPYAFKVYIAESLAKKETESYVYRQLGEHPLFPKFFGEGDHFIVLSYERGLTLYQCLEQGVVIPESVVVEVENARQYVRKRGLNPRDIHLKNVLLYDGKVTVIDVSEYVRSGDDGRWTDLVRAYHLLYRFVRGKALPKVFLEACKLLYKWKERWRPSDLS